MILPAPMLSPEALRPPFTDPAWLYEIKFDGYRCLAGIEDGQVQLRTKALKDCTTWYPEVVGALSKLQGGPHIIDGEACVLNDIGVSDFERFQDRARRRRWYPGCDQVTLCAFDLMVHNGQNVMGLELVERKALLRELLAQVPKQCVLFVQDLPADASLFASMLGAGLQIEGVVAKRRASTYQPGTRSYDWRKIKRPGAVPPHRFTR
jgi:bifunctional non-homologous end joining protein LigD